MTGDATSPGGSVLVMGVSASGKTTVGRALAGRLGLRFVDADDHHPPANRARMAAGLPLDDEHRRPWLAALAALLGEAHATGDHVVLACSALRSSYRDVLRAAGPLTTVHLDLSIEVATRRAAARDDHFLPSSLVASQYEDLEPPTDALVLDATAPTEEVVERAVDALAVSGSGRRGRPRRAPRR